MISTLSCVILMLFTCSISLAEEDLFRDPPKESQQADIDVDDMIDDDEDSSDTNSAEKVQFAEIEPEQKVEPHPMPTVSDANPPKIESVNSAPQDKVAVPPMPAKEAEIVEAVKPKKVEKAPVVVQKKKATTEKPMQPKKKKKRSNSKVAKGGMKKTTNRCKVHAKPNSTSKVFNTVGANKKLWTEVHSQQYLKVYTKRGPAFVSTGCFQ